MNMPPRKSSGPGVLARAVSAEIRAAMGRARMSGNQLATHTRRDGATGLSQNYISKRLRDEADFTLNDVEMICDILGEDFTAIMTSAAEAVLLAKKKM